MRPRGASAIYPRGMEGLQRVTGVRSLAASVSEMTNADLGGDILNAQGEPIGEHNRDLRARRWRGYNGRPGIQDRIRREDPAVQRVALLWEGPAAQERDWTVETEHMGDLAEEVRASVDHSLRAVRSGVGVGIVRGLLYHHLTAPWRGFALARWAFALEHVPGRAGLRAELALGRPIMPWDVARWDYGARGGWDPTLRTGGQFSTEGERIPADEVLHVTFGAQGDNPEGLGLLRSMWSRYDARGLFLRQELIGFDKATTGIPVVYFPEDALQPDITKVQDILAGLRGSQEMNTTIPDGMKVEFIKFPFRADEISAAIKAGAAEILASALCLDTDAEERALLVQSNVDACAQEVTTKIIPALVEYNFGAAGIEVMPVLRGPRVPMMSPEKFTESLRKGLRSGSITGTADVEAMHRRVLGLDEMPDDLIAAYRRAVPVPRVGQQDRPDEVQPAAEDVPGQEVGT